jgi:D-alanyl-D-alanine dipeptidase
MFDYASRVQRARVSMEQRGIDCLMVGVGADLEYLAGYRGMASERLTMLVIPIDDEPTLLVPELEAPRVPAGPFRLAAWKETQDPVAIAASRAGRPTVAAFGDTTWSVFLLELLGLMPSCTFVPASTVTAPLRAVKDIDEVRSLRAAAAAVDRVSARIPVELTFTGRREREIAADIVDMTVEEGHESASFWIVASGPNSASPHHEPGDRAVRAGDSVVIDFGGRYDGYGSDTTRTFSVGPPSERLREVHAVVEEAQRAARNHARAGVSAESVDSVARGVIADAGYGDRFIHRLGHGIGLEGHEAPYLVAGNEALLEPGNAFSIEPGIYLPDELGVRIEDIAVIADDGSLDVLNSADRSLIEVQ